MTASRSPGSGNRGAGMAEPERRALVLVFGDLGRSPRMGYHAVALARRGFRVDLVGLEGDDLASILSEERSIHPHRLAAVGSLSHDRGLARIARALLHRLGQLFRTLRLVLSLPAPTLVLTQTPPPLPTLAVSWMLARLRGATWVVDWHNDGAAVLALSMGRHPLVSLVALAESWLGRRADGHLCVSHSMARDLERARGLPTPTVLYDRPFSAPARRDEDARRSLLRRLAAEDGENASWARRILASDPKPGTNDVRRAALVLAPSSWNLDDDFGLLLRALETYERDAGSSPIRLVVVATGRGPTLERWREEFSRFTGTAVSLSTGWVPADDYPALLAAGDLGLCLHRSASGLDLPMKVADFLGAGLPFCALRYGDTQDEGPCAGTGGVFFSTSTELSGRLRSLFTGFPEASAELEELRRDAGRCHRTWLEGWDEEAAPVLLPDGVRSR